MKKTLCVNVWSRGGRSCIIPFKLWVFIWSVLVSPSWDLMIILWPSDHLEGSLEDCLGLGREEAHSHVDTARVVCCTGLAGHEFGIMLQFSFSSPIFPGQSIIIPLLAIYVVSYFLRCRPRFVGLMENKRGQGSLSSQSIFVKYLKALSPLGGGGTGR